MKQYQLTDTDDAISLVPFFTLTKITSVCVSTGGIIITPVECWVRAFINICTGVINIYIASQTVAGEGASCVVTECVVFAISQAKAALIDICHDKSMWFVYWIPYGIANNNNNNNNNKNNNTDTYIDLFISINESIWCMSVLNIIQSTLDYLHCPGERSFRGVFK